MSSPQYGKPMKEKVPSGYNKFSIQQMTPQQMEMLENSINMIGPDSFLSRLAGGDQSMFEEMEKPALRQFSELQGNLASRFSQGGTGGRRSSGFQNTMSSAASNFAQDLQAKRTDMRSQALRDLMGFSNQLLGQRPYDTGLVEKPQSGFQQFMAGLAPGIGNIAGSKIGSFIPGGNY